MDYQQFLRDTARHAKTLVPLLRYLVLQTETHAFCLGLACAALIGFYPFCVLLLSLMKYQLKWDGGFQVLISTLQAFYPTGRDFLINNLKVSVDLTRRLALGSFFWVFIGAAGVFIPLETGLNRLWKVQEDRPYWQNQLVGLTLTIACCLLAIAFVAINAVSRGIVGLPFGLLERLWDKFSLLEFLLDRIFLHLTAACFFSIAIFVFYKFLPNRRIEAMEVVPAALIAGIVAEIVKDVYVLLLPLMDINSNQGSQGPFYMSVSFVLLGYIEAFVVLGGAFLAAHRDSYPWMGFLTTRRPAT